MSLGQPFHFSSPITHTPKALSPWRSWLGFFVQGWRFISLTFLVLMLIWPISHLFMQAQSANWLGLINEMIKDDYLRWRVLWTLIQALLTCFFCLVLGLPAAWLLARRQFSGKQLLIQMSMLPFVVPTLVAAMGLLMMWGPESVLGQKWLLPFFSPQQQGAVLLLIGNLFFNLSVVLRTVIYALEQCSISRSNAARSLGATAWRCFWRIEWPAIFPAVMQSLCLVFLYSFSGFGLALVLGGQKWATLEVEIYTLVAHELALAPASILAIFSLILLSALLFVLLHFQASFLKPQKADAIAAIDLQNWAEKIMALLLIALISFLCLFPIALLLFQLFTSLPQLWQLLLEAEVQLAIINTLMFSTAGLLLATFLGLSHGMAAFTWPLLRGFIYLPFIASSITIGFGLLLSYPLLSNQIILLVAAYALFAYPFIAQALLLELQQLPQHYLQAARVLGASPWRSFIRIILPLLSPAIRRGMAFAMATCIGEFAVSLFLSRPEWTTLSTLIYQYLGRPGSGNQQAALLLAAFLLLLTLLLFRLIEGKARKSQAI
jgi:thiamine transport system permease protein